jgi:hypothetical protein
LFKSKLATENTEVTEKKWVAGGIVSTHGGEIIATQEETRFISVTSVA